MIPFTALDLAVQKHIPHCFTFSDWIARSQGTYRPTLRADLMGAADRDLLADAFDARRKLEGRPERAWRC